MRHDWRGILSGETRGALGSSLRGLLALATPFYAAAVAVRNGLFDRGWRTAQRVPVPVVSIGNLTAGGTGKTPVVAWIARRLSELDARPGIISRGYGRLNDGVNDELRVLDRRCPGIPHVQNPDRVAGARAAIKEHQCNVLVLDDGFQHRRLARDLDVVLIDALDPWGYGRLLPRGLLREPARSLQRAGLIAITRADQVDEEFREHLRGEIERFSTASIVEIAFVPAGLVNAGGQRRPLSDLQTTTLGAFCGIGNPQAFRRTLTALGTPTTPERFRTYPDHHAYSPADQAELANWVRERGIETVVVTEKDLVKLPQTYLGRATLWALEIDVTFLSAQVTLEEKLRTTLART